MELNLYQSLAFETIECCQCGVLFAVPREWRRKRLADRERFWCPNGHSQSFCGKTEEQKLKEELEKVERRLAQEQSASAQARSDAEHQRRRYIGMKGAHTKLKNRVAAGVCPCCNRSFGDLRKHMQDKHPDFAGGSEGASA